jgi:hypothetical protein
VGEEPEFESSRSRSFWSTPAGISAVAAIIAALTGVVALFINQANSNSNDPKTSAIATVPAPSPGPSSPIHTASTANELAAWSRAVNSSCASSRPRVVAAAQSMNALDNSISGTATPEQAQHLAQLLSEYGVVILDLSSSISRVPAPSTILERVKTSVSQLDDASDKFGQAANAIRGGNGPDAQSLMTPAFDELDQSLRVLGLLGAHSCSDLI